MRANFHRRTRHRRPVQKRHPLKFGFHRSQIAFCLVLGLLGLDGSPHRLVCGRPGMGRFSRGEALQSAGGTGRGCAGRTECRFGCGAVGGIGDPQARPIVIWGLGTGAARRGGIGVGLGEDGRGPTTCSSRRSIAPRVIPQMSYRGLTQPLVCRQPITRCKLEGDASAQCRSLARTPTRWRRGLTAQLARSARIPSPSPSSR